MTSLVHNSLKSQMGIPPAKIDSNSWGSLKRLGAGNTEDESFNFQINLSLGIYLWSDKVQIVKGVAWCFQHDDNVAGRSFLRDWTFQKNGGEKAWSFLTLPSIKVIISSAILYYLKYSQSCPDPRGKDIVSTSQGKDLKNLCAIF